jgi:cation-transporting ATPase E
MIAGVSPEPDHLAPPVVAAPLRTPPGGLGAAEVEARHARGEVNAYRAPTSRTYWEIFRQNAYLGINGILIGVSLLLVVFGLYVEALLTAGPVIANILIGVIQESRAKRKLDQIALLNRPRARVIRDGKERAIDPAEVVLGDLVVARRGDQVLLDGTIVGGGRAELDESLLTGEADPVVKVAGDAVLSGSAVVSGTLVYEVERVGADSFANRLLAEAKKLGDERTPLQREIAATIWAVAGLVLVTSIPVALALMALPGGFDSKETLTAAAVLVTLVPQGLAIMITVTYAAGALRITRLGALVQRQNAVESMARVDTLCVDKTGTLTTQRIAFAAAEPAPGGDPAALPAILGALAASTSAPNRTTDAMAAAHPATALPVADEVPFASERRWSGLRFGDASGAAAVDVTGATAAVATAATGATPAATSSDLVPGATYVLGAPPVLWPHLATPPGDLEARGEEIASRGVRVLLLARAPDGAALRGDDGRPAIPEGLRPVALLGFTEELRSDVPEILGGLARAGIDLKVISGDDPATVEAIGRRVGLPVEGGVVSGLDLAELDDEALAEVAARTSVFGRVEPALKARLVAAFRASGHYVAMVGDGVNDILSLRRANLGIAMESGSAAARGVADLVLLGDAFGVLPKAIIEGQRIVAAMEATLIILLSRTFYVLLIIAGAALLGLPFPLTPRQNSVLAFATVGIPLVVLALWVPPRRLPRSLLGETLRVSIPASIGVVIVALPFYAVAINGGVEVSEAQTALTTLTVFCGLGLLPLISSGAREAGGGRFVQWWSWLLAGIMLVIYLVMIQVPFLRDFYELTPLPGPVLALLLGTAALWTAGVHLLRRTGIIRRVEDALWAGAVAAWRRLRPRRAPST